MTDRDLLPKITSAYITDLPKRLGDPLPQVWATFDDGEEQMLIEYYPDEVSFSAPDFIGLTADEARLLKFGRNRTFLRSPRGVDPPDSSHRDR